MGTSQKDEQCHLVAKLDKLSHSGLQEHTVSQLGWADEGQVAIPPLGLSVIPYLVKAPQHQHRHSTSRTRCEVARLVKNAAG